MFAGLALAGKTSLLPAPRVVREGHQRDEQASSVSPCRRAGYRSPLLTCRGCARRAGGCRLALLTGPERQVLALAYFGGCTQAEIATITDAPLTTVRTRTLTAMRHHHHDLATNRR
jgi:RNA polymerase sigma-70 factor (ECF subfamily)